MIYSLLQTVAGYIMGQTGGNPADKDVVKSMIKQKYNDLSESDVVCIYN